jgi:hypothetical protein
MTNICLKCMALGFELDKLRASGYPGKEFMCNHLPFAITISTIAVVPIIPQVRLDA